MPTANVTSDVLMHVRVALEQFSIEIEGISSRAAARARDCEREGEASIRDTEATIGNLAAQISVLQQRIKNSEEVVRAATKRIDDLDAAQKTERENIEFLQGRVSRLNCRLTQLRRALNRAEDEERQRIQQQINQTETEIDDCRDSIRRSNAKISENEREIRAKKSERSEAQSTKVRCELEESEKNSLRSKYESKNDRMKSAFSKLKEEMERFSSLAQTYERSAVGASDQYRGSLDSCIALVEEYENAHL